MPPKAVAFGGFCLGLAGLNRLDLLQRHVAAGERHELFPAAAGAGEVVDVGLKLRAAVETAGAPRLGLDAQRQQSVRKCGMTPESVPTRTVMLRTPSSASSREMSRTILSSASHSASSCITSKPPS